MALLIQALAYEDFISGSSIHLAEISLLQIYRCFGWKKRVDLPVGLPVDFTQVGSHFLDWHRLKIDNGLEFILPFGIRHEGHHFHHFHVPDAKTIDLIQNDRRGVENSLLELLALLDDVSLVGLKRFVEGFPLELGQFQPVEHLHQIRTSAIVQTLDQTKVKGSIGVDSPTILNSLDRGELLLVEKAANLHEESVVYSLEGCPDGLGRLDDRFDLLAIGNVQLASHPVHVLGDGHGLIDQLIQLHLLKSGEVLAVDLMETDHRLRLIRRELQLISHWLEILDADWLHEERKTLSQRP